MVRGLMLLDSLSVTFHSISVYCCYSKYFFSIRLESLLIVFCFFQWLSIWFFLCDFNRNVSLQNLSCVVAFLQSAVRLPLITIAFHIPFIMGPDTEKWTQYSWFTWAGLVIIVGSLLFFMIETMKKRNRKLPTKSTFQVKCQHLISNSENNLVSNSSVNDQRFRFIRHWTVVSINQTKSPCLVSKQCIYKVNMVKMCKKQSLEIVITLLQQP
jgi:hypothetical protein